MHLVTRTIVYWLGLGVSVICALLLLLAAEAGKVAFPVADQAVSMVLLVAIFLLLLAILYCGVQAVSCTMRCCEVSHCRVEQQYLERVAGQMDSASERQRRHAVQVLSDFFGEPFGPITCWPVEFWPRHRRIPHMVALLKAWWATRAGYPGSALLQLQEAFGITAAVADRFGAHRDGAGPDLTKLPPVAVEDFVESLRPAVERTLLRVAAFVNTVPRQHNVGESDARVADLFARLHRQALSLAWDMRFSAAEPGPTPASKPLETWGEKYSRIRAAETGLPPSPKVVETWVEKFRRMEVATPAAETSAADSRYAPDSPPPLRWTNRMEAVRTQLGEALDRMADSIKDAVLDWSVEEETETAGVGADVIPSEAFARAMGGKIEESLRLVVEAVNQPGTDRRVRELMADLLLSALTYATEVRTRAAPDREQQPC